MNRTRILRFWSLVMGSMDTVTGLLLVLAPAVVLGLLGIPVPSDDALVFLSWMGVFVTGVGLSYGLALGRRSRGETVWAFTGLVRMLVAVFLTVRILAGSLSWNWGVVAASDGLVAVVQFAILRIGWWKEFPE